MNKLKFPHKYIPNLTLLLIFAALFGLLSAARLFFSYAATSTGFIEPETNTVSGSAAVVADATAINGSYIQFNAASLPPVSPPASCTPSIVTPFSCASLWNTKVPANAVYTTLNWPTSPDGSWWIDDSASKGYSDQLYYSSATEPLVTVTWNYTGSTPYSPGGDPNNDGRWGHAGNQTVSIRIPANAIGPGVGDGSVIIIDQTTHISHDFWQFHRVDSTHATASAYGAANYLTDTGWGIPSNSPGTYPGGTNVGSTAVGSNKLAGLITANQVSAGHINHALEMGCSGSLLTTKFTLPAIWGDGGNGTLIHEGERFAIPFNAVKPAIIKSTLGNMVWEALQNYGAYCIDYAGGSNALYIDVNNISASTINTLNTDGTDYGHVGTNEWPTMGNMLKAIN